MPEKTFVPLYRKIYIDLKEKIQADIYHAGEKLPYERELCEMYGVKRVTIRKSLELLAQDGLIVKHMGIGSFVAKKETDANAPAADSSSTILFAMRCNENDIYHNTSSCNTLIFFETEQICRQHGYLLSYVGLDDNTSVADLVRDHSVAGVFLVSSYHEQTILDVTRLKMPTVLLNHYDENMLCVMPDNMGMLKLVIDYLVKKGHRRIAYVNGMPDSRNAQERWEAFRFALYAHGLEADPRLYFEGGWTYEGGRAAARALLHVQPGPTAIFAASDMMAAGVMEELRQSGLRIPEDISIVGYDNLDIDVMLSPPLSSATVDYRHMCEVAFERLKAMMDKGVRSADRYVIRMPAALVERESVAAVEKEA